MKSSLRTFIAIELGDEVEHLITELQKKFQETNTNIKWVLPDNCHLTLKFLGNISPSQLESIEKIMEECAAATRPFELTLEGVGSFPTVKRPKVIWVGVKEGHGQLTKLTMVLEKKLFNIGFPKENRSFNAHITIGHVKSSRSAQFTDQLADASFTPTIIEVKGLTLFQSILSSDGPAYSVLYRSPLK